MARNTPSHFAPMILLLGVVCFEGCVRNTPLFKKLAEAEEKRLAKYTEEALSKSVELQDLDRLCTKEAPLFAGFSLISKHASPSSSTSLTYYYRSKVDYPKVKSFYLNYFSQAGWSVTNQKEGGWGPDTLEFRKQTYKIIVSHGGLGNADYAIDCMKLSDSGEALPNKSLQVSRD